MQQPFEIDDFGGTPILENLQILLTSTIYIYEIVDVYHIPYAPITSHSITVVGIIKELQMGDEL